MVKAYVKNTSYDLGINPFSQYDNRLILTIVLNDSIPLNQIETDFTAAPKIIIKNSIGTEVAVFNGFSIIDNIQIKYNTLAYLDDEGKEVIGNIATLTLLKADENAIQITELQEAVAELAEKIL